MRRAGADAAAALVVAFVIVLGSCAAEAPRPAAQPPGEPAPAGAASLTIARARCAAAAFAPRVLRRLTRGEVERSIRDVFPSLGGAWAGVALGADALSPVGFANDATALVVDEQTAHELLDTAKDVATVASDATHLPGILPCAETTPDAACAGRFIDTFGPRLYRRPIAADERAELADRWASVTGRAGFAAGIKWTLIAMLESPAFLYRSEVGDAGGRLTPDELATELSYTYGGSTPSDDLAAKAARGELATAEARAAEALALLATPAGREAFLEFFRQWSRYDLVLGQDKAQQGNFTLATAPLLVEETRRFVAAVALDGNGGVADLLASGTTFLNADLAAFYGYGAGVTDFAPVARPTGRGVGLLAQASILAGRSHYDFSSPTLRGLFVFEQLLCRQPAARPGGVSAIEDAPVAMTTRARYETQHEVGSCAACHRTFEPFGYALEHFDAAGVYRVNENGNDIDARASVALDDGTTLAVDGLEELAHKLADRADVVDCLGGLLASYVFAGAGGQACLAEDARAALAGGRMGLRDYFVALTGAPSFTTRSP